MLVLLLLFLLSLEKLPGVHVPGSDAAERNASAALLTAEIK